MAPQIFVTGSPGVGKTTLIKRVLEKLRESHPSLKVQGFYTKEVRKLGEREGFEVITVNGSKATLASIHGVPGNNRAPTVGRYKVDVNGFEALALPELQVKEDTQLFVIDEIGKMELFSSAFFPAVEAIITGTNFPVLASIPVKQHSLKQVEKLVSTPGLLVYTIDKTNRDEAAKQIFTTFDSYLKLLL